jgi:MFS family permease
VFFLLYNLAFIDRAVLNILVVPIRGSLGISDLEISLLQGLAFAIFYTVCGLPIGWLVDHKPRRRIVCLGIVLWSLAAAGCGLASRYWHLLLGRIGVAAGEATLAPAAYSILSDTFPSNRLALPMSVMGTGAALGGALAAMLAGLIVSVVPPEGVDLPLVGRAVGWQVALIATGLPGLLLAPLVYTIPDPVRRDRQTGTPAGSFGDTFRYLLANRRLYGGHFLGFGLFSMCNYGVMAWLPTFFIRHHGWDISTAAYVTGSLTLFAGVPGGILMGYTVDRWFSSGRRDAHLLFFVGMALLQLVAITAAVLVDAPMLSVAALVPLTAVASFTGVAAAALQIATPARMRGQVSAIYLLVFNLIGLGFGPSVVAVFTDLVFQDDAKVGSSLLLTFAIFAPLSAACLLVSAPAIRAKIGADEIANERLPGT